MLRVIFSQRSTLAFRLESRRFVIDKFKELKGVCEAQAKGLIPCMNNFDKDARAEDLQVIELVSDDEGEGSLRTVTARKPIITYPRVLKETRAQQNGNGGGLHMTFSPNPSIHGGIPVSSALMIQSYPPVRSGFGTPSIMIEQEPPVKQRRIWSDNAVNTLGVGERPLATQENVKNSMQLAVIKEEDNSSHFLQLQNNTPSLPQTHNTLMASQDLMKMNRNATKSGSQQIPLRIGEPSNVQMAAAAAAAANKDSQDRLKVGGMLFPSAPGQMTFDVGESSNRGMATSNKGKFV